MEPLKLISDTFNIPSPFIFKAVNHANLYLGHQNYQGRVVNTGEPKHLEDVQFKVIPGLTGSGDDNHVSLVAVNMPDYVLRHKNFRVYLERNDGSELFKKDATFEVTQGNAAQEGAISFRSVNFPNHFLRHKNFELWIDESRDAHFAADSSFTLVT